MNTPTRNKFVRLALAALVAVVVAGLVALGVSAPAFATAQITLTLKLTSKTGAALTNYDIYPVEVADGSAAPGQDPDVAVPILGKPGYYSMSVWSGESYTLFFEPNGASAISGTIQYLGGTATLAGATLFTPTSTNNFVAASIATGATITGKVTGPTGAALKNAEVDAYQFDGTSWTSSIYTTTNSSGVFTFANAIPGSYRFEFYAPGGVYPPIFSGSAQSLAAAATTFVAVGTTASVSQKFAVGTGAISGTAIIDVDDNFFYDVDRVALAIPVVDPSLSSSASLNLDKSVAGIPASSKGVWAVKNLPAGDYVVQMEAGSFGESAVYLSPSGEDVPLSQAEIVVVTSGHTSATGTTFFLGSDTYDGADPRFTIDNSGSTPIDNAYVSVAPTTAPLDVADGTTNSAGTVALSNSFGPITEDGNQDGDDNPLVPGWYTVSVIDTTGAHEPIKQQVMFLDYGTNSYTLHLPDLTAIPGFSFYPQIAVQDTPVGTTYTVAATATRSDATLSYQWLNNGNPIYGATSASYTSSGADLGDQLSVRVTANSFGFDPFYAYASVGGSVDPEITTIGSQITTDTELPSISPSTGAFVGTTLQAHVGNWTIDGAAATGVTYSYLWSTGATTSTYVVQPADVGQNITVTVTAKKLGYQDGSAVSTTTVVPGLHPAAVLKKAPVVSHKTASGVTTYSVTAGTWSLTGLTYHYAWSEGDTPVGTDSPSIKTTALTGNYTADGLNVVVTAAKTGYVGGVTAPLVAFKGTDAFFQLGDPIIKDITTSTVDGTEVDVSGTDRLNFGDKLTVVQHANWGTVDGFAPSGYTYQWYRNGVAVKGATTVNYTITTADMSATNDAQISVVETPVSIYFATAHGELSPVGQAMSIGYPTAQATVVGVPADGKTVTAVPQLGVTGVTSTYQWLQCPASSSCTNPTDVGDFIAIPGATKSTLVLHLAYGAVYANVTSSKPGYSTGTYQSNIVTVIVAAQIVQTTLPKITGTAASIAHVGVKLTATPATTNMTGVTNGYVWQTQECSPGSCVDGNWTQVGTGATYTPSGADYGDGGVSIRVVNTASKTNDLPASANSAQYAIGLGTLKLVKAATLSLTTSGGNSFETIAPAVYSPLPTAAVNWVVDGVGAAPGAQRQRDLVGDQGKAIYAIASYSLNGYSPVFATIVAQKGTTTSAGETITNGTQFGDTLELSNLLPFANTNSDASIVYAPTYQWYENNVAIKGATHSSYAPPSTYIGKHITVKVTGTSVLESTLTVTTSNTITLGVGTFIPAAVPTISYTGALQPGTLATAIPDAMVAYGTTGITFKYQWLRSTNGGTSFTPITGATLGHYTPIATDATDEVEVTVTATKTGYTSLPLTSLPSTIQYSPTLEAFTPPSLSGTGKVGGALALSVGVWNTPTLTYVYQWYRNGVLIGGVTGTSWTPTADSVGDQIVVKVTASKVGYAPVAVTTQSVQVSSADAPTTTVAPVITKLASPANTYAVSTGTWNVDGLAYSYQWQIDGVDANGTNAGGVGPNSATFTADASQSGVLTVVITATRTGYTTAVKTITGPTLAFI
ncbi:MAG TPA: carboxypeptidase regulatory-like domain-containing protein [Galbitalea sp.]|nr:carboxypeptidase regulatory-like domain-containing protein [Galbitalea sp.]